MCIDLSIFKFLENQTFSDTPHGNVIYKLVFEHMTVIVEGSLISLQESYIGH